MLLSDILTFLPKKEVIRPIPEDLEVLGVAYDSRNVSPGDLFVAVVGQTTDGHEHIAQAVAKGAAAVLGQRFDLASDVPYIVTPDSRAALARAAAAFYGFPSHNLKLIGVTGTDGKTTTTTLIQALLASAGYKASMITTVGATIGDAFFDIGVHVTTPGAVELQSFLAQMVRAGTEYAILETTSHALDQLRVYQCAYDVAVVTNITHEHFDYHGSYERYRDAKAMLFRSLTTTYRKPGVPKISVLNADDASFEHLRRIDADIRLTYGLAHAADFRAKDILHTSMGTTFTALTPVGDIRIEMPLLGEHNVYNALAAMAAGHSQGIPLEIIKQGLESVKSVVARMERVDCGQDFDVFVDYAHTPNALDHILRSARALTQGQVIVVFGLSGGPRDKSKRPIMGEVAAKLADKIVITSVDWYAEDIDSIMAQIAAGCEKADRLEGVDYWCIADRKAGIGFGIGLAQGGDIVIIAGKGHERVISYNSVDRPWDEFEAVRDSLRARQ